MIPPTIAAGGPVAKWAAPFFGIFVAALLGVETEVWVAGIGGTVSAYGVYLGYRQATNKTRLDWHQVELERLREQAKADDERIASLERELRAVQLKLLDHELGVRRLIDQLTALDHTPVWEPSTP